jgi:hypothetical protein
MHTANMNTNHYHYLPTSQYNATSIKRISPAANSVTTIKSLSEVFILLVPVSLSCLIVVSRLSQSNDLGDSPKIPRLDLAGGALLGTQV